LSYLPLDSRTLRPEKLKNLVREKCDDDEDRLERLARSSFDHLLPAQGSVKAGPRVTILSRTRWLASRFAEFRCQWR
jgi:DUF1365 family protein